jgi:hypothetical protein
MLRPDRRWHLSVDTSIATAFALWVSAVTRDLRTGHNPSDHAATDDAGPEDPART